MVSKTKIVIADDMEPILLYLEKVISNVLEFEVVGRAKDGKELIDLVVKHKPDLVITDVEMPECNGIQAVEELNKLNIQTKYIFVTGNKSCIITCNAKKLGVLKVITKPILDDKKFVEQVKQALIKGKKCEIQHEKTTTNETVTITKKENYIVRIINKFFSK